MKKFTFILAFMLMMSVSSIALATDNPAAGERLVLTGLEIAVSPGVMAYYLDDGATTGEAQWFTIATLHQGGTKVYATAQNSTSTYSQEVDTSVAVTYGVFNILTASLPTRIQAASDTYWTGSDWER